MASLATRFDNRVAIVCGASRGIGYSVAAMLAAQGASVVLSSRKQAGLEAAVASLDSAFPGRAVAVVADAARDEDLERLVDQTLQRFGRVDVVVYNAGASPHYGPLLGSTRGAWERAFQINVLGALTLVRRAADVWMRQHGGAVVTVASLGGLRPRPDSGVYNTTKAALIMLTRQLAAELGSSGIRVNGVAPGVVKTDFSAVIWQDAQRLTRIVHENTLGRLGTAEEVASVVTFLASDAASFVNGQIVVIDGGSDSAH